MNYTPFNPNRVLLSNNWKNSISALIGIQEIFSNILESTNVKIEDNSAPITTKAMQKMIRKIGQYLKEPTNDELKKGILIELTRDIDNFVTSKSTSGEINFVSFLSMLGASNTEIIQTVKRISDLLVKSYDGIQEGNKEKLDVKTITSSNLNNIVSKGFSNIAPALSTAVFGQYAPVANVFGSFALDIANKLGSTKYQKEIPKFNNALQNRGILSGIPSSESQSISTNPFLQKGNSQNISVYSDIYSFFNKGAFSALWTKKMLELAKEKQGNSTTSSFNLPNFNTDFFIKSIVTAAVGGWFAGKAINDIKVGSKTVGNYVQNFFEKTIFRKDFELANIPIDVNSETASRMQLIQRGMNPAEAYARSRAHFNPNSEKINSEINAHSENIEIKLALQQLQMIFNAHHTKVESIFLQNKVPTVPISKELRKNISDPMMDMLNMGIVSQ